MSERTFSKELRQALSSKPGLRCHSSENKIAPGMPDVLVCRLMREAFWIELKVTQTGLNTNQMMWRNANPEETVMLATQLTNSGRFNLKVWNRETNEWDTIWESVWPIPDVKDLIAELYER